MIITKLIAHLTKPAWTGVVWVLGIAGLFFSWLALHDHKVATKAKTEVVSSMNKQAETLTNAALKAREPSSLPGAVERLRRYHCSDCDGQAPVPGN